EAAAREGERQPFRDVVSAVPREPASHSVADLTAMSAASFECIPGERREPVQAAVGAAFGGRAVDALQPVTGGASGALTYRVDAAGRMYMLRIETRRSPLRNPHQYDCMRIASEAGIAPALRYVDANAGVAVMDFVRQRPLAEYPGGASALAR